MPQPFSIAIHGGAGTILREQMSDALKASILADLEKSVRAGHQILAQSGDALDAVVAAVKVLEDVPISLSPLEEQQIIKENGRGFTG